MNIINIMRGKVIVFAFFLLIIVADSHAFNVTFLHEEGRKIKISHPAFPELLQFEPMFSYPQSTVYNLPSKEYNFYELMIESDRYFLWINKSSKNIDINLNDLESSNTQYARVISEDQWNSQDITYENTELDSLHQLNSYYRFALDSLSTLSHTNEKFRKAKGFNTLVYDHRSAKRLYNVAIEKFGNGPTSDLAFQSASYVEFWTFMYKLYYQYFHSNAFKGLSKQEIVKEIKEDFAKPESEILLVHHFFGRALPLYELKENLEMLKENMNSVAIEIAKAAIQKKAVEDANRAVDINYVFGIDVEAALSGFFARDSSEKKNILIFWSIWDESMIVEFNKLYSLKKRSNENFNFIHICIDAYDRPEKVESFISQNQVGGYHLLPKQSDAFRKSNYSKELKIRDFPFYVITSEEGKILESEEIPLQISDRLKEKVNFYSAKK